MYLRLLLTIVAFSRVPATRGRLEETIALGDTPSILSDIYEQHQLMDFLHECLESSHGYWDRSAFDSLSNVVNASLTQHGGRNLHSNDKRSVIFVLPHCLLEYMEKDNVDSCQKENNSWCKLLREEFRDDSFLDSHIDSDVVLQKACSSWSKLVAIKDVKSMKELQNMFLGTKAFLIPEFQRSIDGCNPDTPRIDTRVDIFRDVDKIRNQERLFHLSRQKRFAFFGQSSVPEGRQSQAFSNLSLFTLFASFAALGYSILTIVMALGTTTGPTGPAGSAGGDVQVESADLKASSPNQVMVVIV